MTLILAFDSTPVAIPGVTKLQAVIGYSAWVATALCLIGLIVTGALMAVAHHHGTNQHVGRLGMVAAGCLIVGAASPIAGSILGFNLFTSDPEAIPGLAGVQTVIGYVSWVAAGAVDGAALVGHGQHRARDDQADEADRGRHPGDVADDRLGG